MALRRCLETKLAERSREISDWLRTAEQHRVVAQVFIKTSFAHVDIHKTHVQYIGSTRVSLNHKYKQINALFKVRPHSATLCSLRTLSTLCTLWDAANIGNIAYVANGSLCGQSHWQ
ncbi:hypothetical protein B7P43_G18330 [Cryptotermes secundus]|uniref:Uncharacterized protein n=1 Tax=Cryptotermes secundus TaxID=105785 RepID=A0A2J7QZY8_9NEOP|nr:hypothetical protein B7P43_G18330 [Cryptotermes secundus]